MPVFRRFFRKNQRHRAPADASQKAGMLKMILSFEDPKYPGTNHYDKLIDIISDSMSRAGLYPNNPDASNTHCVQILQEAINSLIAEKLSDEKEWKSITNCFSGDIFEIIAPYVKRQIEAVIKPLSIWK